MARATKLTQDVHKRLVLLVKNGVPRSVAAHEVGVAERTLRKWLAWGAEGKRSKLYRQLFEDLEQSVAEAESRSVLKVKAAGDADWRAAAWFLERRFPRRWGQQINFTLNEELTKLLDRAEGALENFPGAFEALLEALSQPEPEDGGASSDGS